MEADKCHNPARGKKSMIRFGVMWYSLYFPFASLLAILGGTQFLWILIFFFKKKIFILGLYWPSSNLQVKPVVHISKMKCWISCSRLCSRNLLKYIIFHLGSNAGDVLNIILKLLLDILTISRSCLSLSLLTCVQAKETLQQLSIINTRKQHSKIAKQ